MRRFRYGSSKKMRQIGPAKTAHQRCAVFGSVRGVDMRQISLPKKAHLFPDVQGPPLISAIFTKDAPNWPCENGASLNGEFPASFLKLAIRRKVWKRCAVFGGKKTLPIHAKRCAVLASEKRRIFFRFTSSFFDT